MADVTRVIKATRVLLVLEGALSETEKAALSDCFESKKGDFLITMKIYYDCSDDTTTIQLSPCTFEDAWCEDANKHPLNYRASFSFSADALRDILQVDDIGQNLFIEKEWIPFRKEILEKSVVLPMFMVKKDRRQITFELLSVDQACEKADGRRRKVDRVKSISTKRRNEDMEKAKCFLLNRFAEHIEKESPRTNPTAHAMDILSVALVDKLVAMSQQQYSCAT